MPRGIPNKKPELAVKEGTDERDGAAAPQAVSDIASGLYKDRSGVKLGGGHSEGASNFGAITAAALETVRLAEEMDAADKRRADGAEA